MFRWLTRWRKKKAREIFRYHDGIVWRAEDPFEINARLEGDEECPDYRTTYKGVERGELETTAEFEALLRRVFGILPFKQGGLTAMECFSLFGDWIDFCLGLKKKYGMLPMPMRRLIPSHSMPMGPTTQPDSASSSTPSESPAGEPSHSSVPFVMPLQAS